MRHPRPLVGLTVLALVLGATGTARATEVGPLYVGEAPSVAEVVIDVVDDATGQGETLRCGTSVTFTFAGSAVPGNDIAATNQVTAHLSCAGPRGGVVPERMCALARLQSRYPGVDNVFDDVRRAEQCSAAGADARATTEPVQCYPCSGYEYRGVGDFTITVPLGKTATRPNGHCTIQSTRVVFCRVITGSVWYRQSAPQFVNASGSTVVAWARASGTPWAGRSAPGSRAVSSTASSSS